MEATRANNSTLNSLIVAVAICFHFINGVAGIAGVSVVTAAVIWILSFASLLRGTYSIQLKHLFFLLIMLLIFLVSLLVMSDVTYTFEYLQYFLLFDIVAFFAGQQRIDAGKTVELINYIGLPGLLFLMHRGVENEYSGYEMGMSYAILGILFAAVIHVVLQLKKPLVAYANIGIAVFLLAPIAPRGVWLSLIIFMFAVLFDIITLLAELIIVSLYVSYPTLSGFPQLISSIV